MENDERVLRTKLLLGEEGMAKLRGSTVMIVGLGAVGGYVLEAVARSGVGHLILVDFDSFDATNVNRQILALTSTIGQKKIEAARSRVHEINPDCKVETLDMFVNAETLPALLEHKADLVIDAIDALNPKCCLMEELCRRGIPFISSMGAALKTDVSHIRYAKLSNSKNCGLAKFIRKRLKKRGVDICRINCVFSDEQIDLPETAIISNVDEQNPNGRARNTLGSLPTVTAIFGLTIANRAILYLSGRQDL